MAEEFRFKELIWPIFSAFFWGAALLPLAIVVIFVFHTLNPYCCSRFDAREWKMAEEGSDWETTENQIKCIRGRMLTDLRLRHLKAGMRREELITLLGPADRGSEASRLRGCLTYYIGYCRGLGFSFNSISFCFDAGGHVLNGDGEVR